MIFIYLFLSIFIIIFIFILETVSTDISQLKESTELKLLCNAPSLSTALE